MTGWTPLTQAEVLNQFNDSETSAYDSAKGDDAAASMPDIIGTVIDQIRLAYADGGRDVDPLSGTIPDGEKNRAIAMVRWKYLVALPTGKSLAENRQSEAKTAEDYFLEIAKRTLQGSGGAEIVSQQTRRATRCKLNGLV